MKYLLAVCVATLLLLSACDISEPRIPSWDVDLTVPLMNERYLMSELADDLNIQVGENDVLMITGTGQAETPPFGHVNFTPEITVEDLPLTSGMEFDFNLPITDPEGRVYITYGEITQGTLGFLVNATDPANTELTMQIPTITEPDGTPLEIVYNGTTGWQSHSLIDCWVGETGSGNMIEYLQIHFSVSSNQPDGTPLGTAGLRLASQIGFSEFEGYLYEYERGLTGTLATINIDYPHDLEEAVELQQANVYVEVSNQVGFNASLHGELYAKNTRTGVERTVDIVDEFGVPFTVGAATFTGPTITSFNFSNNVSELLQIMPDMIELRNSHLVFNGGGNGIPGFVREDQQVFCTYQVDAPFTFILHEHEIYLSEPTEISISQENTDLLENVLGAALTLGITNRIPVGGSGSLYISSSPDIDPTNPATYEVTKSITLHSSLYTGPDVDEDGQQNIQLALTEEELQIFTNPLIYMFWTFSFEESGGVVTITASPSDYIQVKCMLSVGLHVEVES